LQLHSVPLYGIASQCCHIVVDCLLSKIYINVLVMIVK
jgi:hypothetical protein